MEESDKSSNSTFSSHDYIVHPLRSYFPILKDVLSITLIALLLVIMLAMGSVITWKEVYYHLRRPIGILTGMLSQFVLLPLVGFGLAQTLKLNSYHAIGLLVLTCCPGGTVSNIFTYFTNGDVSLSMVMTITSTVFALGFMPLNLLIYTSSWTSSKFVVPYKQIAITLVLILIPVTIGMFTRWKMPKVAKVISKLGSTAGLLAIIFCLILQSILYPTIFNQPWEVWFSSVALPVFGFSVGYVLSFFFRQTSSRARTVGLETGAQNVSLALTIFILSFPADSQKDMLVIPLLFGIFLMAEGFFFCIFYRIYLRLFAQNNNEFQQISQINQSISEKIDKKFEFTDLDSANHNCV